MKDSLILIKRIKKTILTDHLFIS